MRQVVGVEQEHAGAAAARRIERGDVRGHRHDAKARARGNAAQLTASMRPRRPLRAWMALAKTSLPTPVSPRRNSSVGEGARRLSFAQMIARAVGGRNQQEEQMHDLAVEAGEIDPQGADGHRADQAVDAGVLGMGDGDAAADAGAAQFLALQDRLDNVFELGGVVSRASNGARRQVVARVPRNGDPSELCGMLELPVAAFLRDEPPARSDRTVRILDRPRMPK